MTKTAAEYRAEADHYLIEANRIRLLVDQAPDLEAKRLLLTVAESYEQLAAKAEDRAAKAAG